MPIVAIRSRDTARRAAAVRGLPLQRGVLVTRSRRFVPVLQVLLAGDRRSGADSLHAASMSESALHLGHSDV